MCVQTRIAFVINGSPLPRKRDLKVQAGNTSSLLRHRNRGFLGRFGSLASSPETFYELGHRLLPVQAETRTMTTSAEQEQQDLEDELLACLESDDEEEPVPHGNSSVMTRSKWERFVHLGEDLTIRICMVRRDCMCCLNISSQNMFF